MKWFLFNNFNSLYSLVIDRLFFFDYFDAAGINAVLP
jgi:hypothetical protein